MDKIKKEIALDNSIRYHQRVAYRQKKNRKFCPKSVKKKIYSGKYRVEIGKDYL